MGRVRKYERQLFPNYIPKKSESMTYNPEDRLAQDKNLETSETQIIRTMITGEMVAQGVMALARCEDTKEQGAKVTDHDLVCEIYAAMRLIESSR